MILTGAIIADLFTTKVNPNYWFVATFGLNPVPNTSYMLFFFFFFGYCL